MKNWTQVGPIVDLRPLPDTTQQTYPWIAFTWSQFTGRTYLNSS